MRWRGLVLVLLVVCSSTPSLAAVVFSERDTQLLKAMVRSGPLVNVTGAGVPATCTLGQIYFDTTQVAGNQLFACVAANTWQAITNSNVAQGLDANFDINPTINGANNATPLRVGDGVSAATDVCIKTDSTLGAFVGPCAAADTKTWIFTSQKWGPYSIGLSGYAETITPGAASPLLVWQYPTAAIRPIKSVWIDAGALTVDGTNCTAPADRTVGGIIITTVQCADNNSSVAIFKLKAPKNWDGGTFVVEQTVIQTAADTNPLNADFSMQCRGTTEVLSASWGTSQTLNANMTGSNAHNFITSAAITPTGGCAAGDMIYGRYVVNATGTTTAMGTVHILGFSLYYTEVSRSN